MECKEILKELIKFDTYKDKQNKEIMGYIQEVLEKKDFKVDYRSKCLVMSIKDKLCMININIIIMEYVYDIH